MYKEIDVLISINPRKTIKYQINEKVFYWSYIDGIWQEGVIIRFTEDGMESVAVIEYEGNIEKYKGKMQYISFVNIRKLDMKENRI